MRSSQKYNDKIIDTAAMRTPYKPGREAVHRPVKKVYCRECEHRKRGNTWKLDFCRKLKKLCSKARQPNNIAVSECEAYEEKKKPEVFEVN